MFGFLKDKLKSALSKFSKDVDQESEEIKEKIEEAPKKEDKKKEIKKEPEKKSEPKQQEKKPEIKKEEKKPEPKVEEKKTEPKEEKKKPEQKVAKQPEIKMPEPPIIPSPKVEKAEKKEPQVKLEETKVKLDTKPLKGEEDSVLAGLRESLQSFNPDKIRLIAKNLGIAEAVDKEIMISSILEKPLAEVDSAIQEVEEVQEFEKETEEIKQEEEVIDEEVREAEDEFEEEKVPEAPAEEAPKKAGFFKRIFGIGKKKEEETAEEEKQPEKKVEKPEPADLASVEKVLKEEEKEIEEEDKELEEAEKEEEKEIEEVKREKEILKAEEKEAEPEEEHKGFFGKLTDSLMQKTLSDSKFEDIFFDLEMALLENNVAVEVIAKIKQDLHNNLVNRKLKRNEIEEIVARSLKGSIDEILSFDKLDIIANIREKRRSGKPFVIIFVGINGSGKTTTIAKMAKHFMDNDLKPVLVAADTFRAAAIQQLEEHANNLSLKLIKHDYGSDPAAVAFDGIKYAEAKGIDVVLIDTAGRLHSNANLMDEMKKIIRISNPDMKIFIGESITGNDCIEQAQSFNTAIGIDGIILSKADVDEKGGAALSVSYVTGKPILFIGTGQTYESIEPFDKSVVLNNLGLE